MTPRNVWIVARREFLERVQKKSFLIFTILTPLLFGALMVLPALLLLVKADKVYEVAVLDRTGWMGNALLNTPEKEPDTSTAERSEGREPQANLRFRTPGPGENLESLKARVVEKALDGVLEINPAEKGDAKAVYYGLNLGNIFLKTTITGRMNRAVLEHRLQGAGADPSLAKMLREEVPMEEVKVGKGGKTEKGSFELEYFKAIILCMLLYLLIMIYGTTLMRGVMEERNGKIAEVVISCVRPFELLLGKIAGLASVGLLQYAIWFALGFGLVLANPIGFVAKTGSAMPKLAELVMMVVYFLLGFFFYAALYAAVGAICTTEQEAQQWQTPIALSLAMPVMILFAIIQNPDSTWVIALSLVPLFTPTLMMVRISVMGVPFWQILASVLSLFVGILVVAYIGGKIYRVGLLMTGKRPTIPEILRWVREG